MSSVINDLYQATLSGNPEAENRLFEALTERFRFFTRQRVGNKMEVEEIVQDALATVLDKYRKMEFETSFAAWAHKVVENKFLYFLQRKGRDQARNTPLDNPDTVANPGVPDPTLRRRLLACLKKVCAINIRYARILNYHLHGYSRQEVSDKMKITLNQTYVSMSRARSMLKKCLAEGEVTE